MIDSLSLDSRNSFLSKYKISVLGPEKKKRAKKTPVSMPSLQQKITDPRAQSLRMILGNESDMQDAEAAEIKSKLAVSMWQAGKNEQALKLAEQSLEIYPKQWTANRVKIEILMARNLFEQAYEYIKSLKVSQRTPEWDYQITRREYNLCAASCQWRMKNWDLVDKHLRKAFPKGVSTMPTALQEDWFRLSLYRHQPNDAAEAAALLASTRTLEFTDALLQTLVQQGWTGKALPIYRHVYSTQPQNELLRRRLVALCIREGEIEEARKLTESGALNLNP